MNVEKIGLFIKELRTEKKMTQKELSEKLNLTDRAISKWERVKGLTDISYLEDLSSIFEVSILELLKSERIDTIQDKDILYSVKYYIQRHISVYVSRIISYNFLCDE